MLRVVELVTPESRPVFYFDLASPWCYLVAERVSAILPEVPVWQPVLASALATGDEAPVPPSPRPGELGPGLGPDDRDELERRAALQGLPPLRWPSPLPTDSLTAMRAASFAQATGRVVAYSLAAFRQAFAGGRDLGVTDNVLIAAAACELHPRAVLKGVESRSVRDRLAQATAAASTAGVREVPTIAVGERRFVGEARVEDAAAALAGASLPHL